jgi:hypothetical protein
MRINARSITPLTSLPAVQTSTTSAATLSAKNKAQLTPEELSEYNRACQRVIQMPNNMGWVLISVGVVGVILPGIPGWPFLVIGGAVLVPGGRKWMSRRMVPQPGPALRTFVRVLNRFLDDFERDCRPLSRA